MKTFIIGVENLGVIKNAHVEASHLNIICGPNNSGKSFFLHSIYAFLKYGGRLVNIPVSDELVKSVRTTGKVFIADLTPYIRNVDSYIDQSLPTFIERLPSMLAKQKALFKNTKLKVKVDPAYLEKMTQIDRSSDFEVTETCRCSYKKVGNTLEIILVNTGPDFPDEDLIKALIGFVIQRVITWFFHYIPVYLVTSERTGTAMYEKMIHLPQDSEQKPIFQKKQSILSICHLDELKLVSSFGQIAKDQSLLVSQNENDIHSKRALQLLQRIVSGKYEWNETLGVRFRPNDTQLELDMTEVSSSIRALLSLDMMLSHSLYHPNTILLIDEPELNLTPENQRLLARLLVQLVKIGVGVSITTHSDYLVREVNTLIALSRNTVQTKKIAKDFGYAPEEMIEPDKVALYYIKKPSCVLPGENAFEKIKFDGDFSVEIPPFDDSIAQMNEMQARLS
jgi:ABC-type Mn2+/Zn2+ transport system ATPase subunit